MALSKRTRFEVLRRDGFRCTYCGAAPTEKELHVDHVVPVALGGGDLPNNLTTACADCNLGKASTSPSEVTVAAVSQTVATVAATRERVIELANAQADALDEYEFQVLAIWDSYVPQYRHGYAHPPEFGYIDNWFKAGIPLGVVEKGIRVAVGTSHIAWPGKARYAAGVIRNTMTELEATDGAN